MTIDANAPPSAALVVTCSGPTCSFDASGSADPDGAIAAYSLSFGDAHSTDLVTSLTASHAYPTGTFTANLYVLDNGGAVAVRTATVTVTNMLPVATFTYRVQRRNGLTVLKTPVRAPQANAFCERLK